MVSIRYLSHIDSKNRQLLKCIASKKPTAEKLKCLKRCLERGADVNTMDEEENSPIILAVRREEAVILKLLIKRGANVNTLDMNDNTPMHDAVRYREEKIVKILLKAGAEINAQDLSGITPLHIAASLGRTSIGMLLINKFADVNAQDDFGDTPLHHAAYSGETSMVQLLIDNGADVNEQATDGYTPLHGAARSGKTVMLELLLTKDAKVNRPTTNGYTPLHEAASFGDTSMVKLLLDNGSDVNEQTIDGYTALHGAAQAGNTCVAELLLSKGAKVNAETIRGYTPLHGAVSSGAIPLAKKLLKYKTEDFERLTDAHPLLHDIACTNKAWTDKYLRKMRDVLLYTQKPDELIPQSDHKLLKSTELSMVDLLLHKGANVNSQTMDKYTPLHVAANYGETSILELLLSKGADLRASVANGDTALHMAALSGVMSVVELLLSKGADVNVLAENGYTPLHAAARSGNSLMVQMLLEQGAKVNASTDNRYTPLHAAMRSKNDSTVNILFNNGANSKHILHVAVRCKFTSIIEMLLNKGAKVNEKTVDGFTPLHTAVSTSYKPVVKLLLNNGANVNEPTSNGHTPLYEAVKLRDATIVEILLENGANVNAQTTEGDTPLHKASRLGDISIMKLLFKWNAIVNAESRLKETPLHLAAKSKQVAAVELLLNEGATVNVQDINGTTPLHNAVCSGVKSIVKLLLKKGANVNAQDSKNYTPLHHSARLETHHIAELLLNKGAEVNAQCTERRTPLHMAALCGLTSIVELLLNKGADVNSQTMYGDTPLFSATSSSNVSLVELLLSKGADVNVQAANGSTPLHHASGELSRGKSIVELLLKSCANFNAQTTNGYTPLHEAAYTGDTSSITLLLKWGANVNALAENSITPLHQAVNSFSISKVELLLNNGANINLQNSDGDTPLHIALRQENNAIASLLVRRGANVMLRNRMGDIPIFYAMLFSLKDNTDIVNLLFAAETKSSQNKILDSHSSSSHYKNDAIQTNDTDIVYNCLYNKEQYKYLKNTDNSGFPGQLYETKLLSLILIRVLNHEKLEYDFSLAANMDGIGEMDDICLRYQVKGPLQRPVVLFIQVKHRESKEKLTDETLWNDTSDFSIQKFFQSCLMIKTRFQVGNKDPMFEGELNDIDCYFIVYTTAIDMITKKKADSEPNEIMHDILSTEKNTVPFQYSYDEADIDRLINVQTEFPVNKLEASYFLTRLWFYPTQARQDEVENMVKDEISKYYNKEEAANHFKIHSNAIFIKAHDEIHKWWRLVGTAPYLTRSSDVFRSAKLAYLYDVVFTIQNIMKYLEVRVDLEFKQHFDPNLIIDNRQIVSKVTSKSFHTRFGKSFKIFDANEQNTVKALLKYDITDSMQINEKITSTSSDDISLSTYNAYATTNAYNVHYYEYTKKSGTSEIGGTLFRTKLLSLVHLRVQNHEEIEHFHIATKIRGIEVLNDICLRFQIKGIERPVVLFMQLMYKEDPEKGQLTVEGIWNSSGTSSLPGLFKSYLDIENRFRIDNDNEEAIFERDYREVDCYFILYTTAKENFARKKTDCKVMKVIQDIINTQSNSRPYQYDYDNADMKRLAKLITNDRIRNLGKVFLKSVKNEKYMPTLLDNKFIARYHVAMGRVVLQQCEVQPEIEKYRVWKIRPEFFKSNAQYLVTLKNSFIELFIPKRDQKGSPTELQHLLDDVQKKLLSLKIKLPLAFGNIDIPFCGSKENVQKKIKGVAGKLLHLIKLNKDKKNIEINDQDVSPGKKNKQGIINFNDVISSAVGNVLILDSDTDKDLLKLDLNNEALPYFASLLLQELKDQNNQENNLELYRFKINTDNSPKYSFNEDEADMSKAKDFLDRFWFYPYQAKEDKVEQILNYEINKKKPHLIRSVEQNTKNSSNLITLLSIDGRQKWWMQTPESPYLSRASELFEQAELADICNLLQTVINFMYISGIDRLDIKVKRYGISKKSERIQQVFINVSRNLFQLFDTQFNQPFDVNLNDKEPITFDTSLLSLRIHPEMEWVAIILMAGSGAKIYRVVAKVGLGRELHRAKDRFMVHEQMFSNQYCRTRDCLENVILYTKQSVDAKLVTPDQQEADNG